VPEVKHFNDLSSFVYAVINMNRGMNQAAYRGELLRWYTQVGKILQKIHVIEKRLGEAFGGFPVSVPGPLHDRFQVG
jgi:hypothetical protein